MASPKGLISENSGETFPAVDVNGELNPTKVDDFPIDAVSFHVSTVKDVKEEEEEKQKKDSGSNLMSTLMISGVVVAVIGVAAFVVSRKLREQ